ncbi:50S ribosomal protein L29 [Blattabacterium sp. (Blattella germanica) str. Bge]|uniref:50S ribosomal protein L29 n=1 Tax=Blattabacterium sp. (Blattella germanica) TaxID=624186 RepID=UPI0001BB6140|nr:50S ribosomal protein L29 [Blattabacterium sp. (Blattella germanica)]ACY40266.1 50S ribosomal protein L29 [Blattabacterium sp. (Blattella germanica) str. Bge]
MKNSEIKTLLIDDLIYEIQVHEKNYQNIKFYHSIKIHKNPMIIRILRRKIARLKTELNKKINDRKTKKI